MQHKGVRALSATTNNPDSVRRWWGDMQHKGVRVLSATNASPPRRPARMQHKGVRALSATERTVHHARTSRMPYLIKKLGSGLHTQAGSSFGGMSAAKKDVDEYLKTDGSWSSHRDDAHVFGQRIAAENKLVTLPHLPGRGQPYDIVEQ
jgi:hypothetical protein